MNKTIKINSMSLREATSTLHSKAEKMEFNQRMFRGELSQDEYLNYLIQQSYIFQEIENRNLPHTDLKRLDLVHEDINELGGYKFKILKSTTDYFVYLGDLNQEQLNAHIYLNYLALAYGGQMMKTKVPGSGKIYDFENMMECVGSIRAIQNDQMADEVNKGFQYIINILDELQTNIG
jgi:heme oxygenase